MLQTKSPPAEREALRFPLLWGPRSKLFIPLTVEANEVEGKILGYQVTAVSPRRMQPGQSIQVLP